MFKEFNSVATINEEKRKEIEHTLYDMFKKYGHNPTEKGVKCILDEYLINKGKMINAFRTSQYWDEENLRLVIPSNFRRDISKKTVGDFARWCSIKAYQIYKQYQANIGLFNAEEYYEARNNLYYKMDSLNSAITYTSDIELRRKLEARRSEIKIDYDRMGDVLTKFHNETGINKYTLWLEEEKFNELARFRNAMDEIEYYYCPTVNKNLMERTTIKKVCETFNIPLVEGNKTSRLVQKMCKAVGLDKIVDMQMVSWYDQDGNFHEREKDMGWNFQYAKYCDGINPKEIKKDLYISLNPVDYVTCSWLVSTASCHDFSRGQHLAEFGIETSKDYSGCYCSGIISYMLDGTSVVSYWKANVEKYDDWTKEKRCMFHIGEDKIVQGRLYPDGRDGSDEDYEGGAEGLATQFRNVVQSVIAEIFDVPNLWTLKRGTCHSYTDSYGTHYRDYNEYSDCSCSILKGTENERRVMIGHRPFCVTCGKAHDIPKELSCCGYAKCAHCGESIDEDSYDMITAIDRNGDEVCFCDDYCARNEGYVHAYNDYEYVWREECDCFCDNNGDWYVRDAYDFVETEDGTFFACADDAYDAGYELCEDDWCWYDVDELCWCEDDERYHLEENCYKDDWDETYFYDTSEIVEVDGLCFRNEDNAIAYGYVYNEDNNVWEVA